MSQSFGGMMRLMGGGWARVLWTFTAMCPRVAPISSALAFTSVVGVTDVPSELSQGLY